MAADHDTRDGTVAVVVPIKAFERAKGRLSEHLDPDQRRDLAESMAAGVVDAARRDGFAVIVVTDDDEVEAWARARGADVTRPTVIGLDAAADAGVAAAAARGWSVVVIAHADLPYATTFAHLTDRSADLVLVPDRHHDGTNVLVTDVDSDFTFHYGPGSLQRHIGEAARRSLTVEIVDDPALAWDVDVPADLPTDRTVAVEGTAER